ncbi:multidrug efflux pump subunit AcrB [Aequitasia blattaphilus]|uniref:Efflux RND transporter permease subunit n=1 Tax=Aequitasia blattaphilus TaxID=2949332 RepID=A0ABT1EAG0_9FIRM|nr:efflux RND transporter permease subunit [Aequitasia blattaphilus]MCP1102829.1 efflux RND transporter permease subunit [Aequitasia blattaphilus]MCR8615469.1 efflux RND transporter permease subunit [Aequitasia blattaphilus]
MLSKFSVKKPYTVVVAVILVILLGVVSLLNMTVDLLPKMSLPYVLVFTSYEGASPEAVETIVTKPIEQSMATISNIKSIDSTSSEGSSVVFMEFEQTANMDAASVEMRESLDQIYGYWPEGIGNPMILKLNPNMLPIIIMAVSVEGEDEVGASKYIEEKVLPNIESIEGVASVSTLGSVEESIEITLDDQKIRDVNASIQKKMDEEIEKGKKALADAKTQVEQGKSELENATALAASTLGSAESEISVKAEELKQAQLEITEKKAELSVLETQINQGMAIITATKDATQGSLNSLEELKAREGEIQAQYDEISGIPIEEQSQEQMLLLVELGVQLETLSNYDSVKAGYVEVLTQIGAQEETLAGQSQLLADGLAEIENIQSQVNEGALTLAQARGSLASGQIQASAGLSQGAAQIASGEALIQAQEAQAESAIAGMGDTSSIAINGEMIKALLMAENFSMPAGYVTEDEVDYLVRIGEAYKSAKELESLPILNVEGIQKVSLIDVAKVERVNNSEDTYAKINDKNGLMLVVQKQTGYSTGDISDKVLNKMVELGEEDENLEYLTLMDQGVYIDLTINSVFQNLIYGGLLAVLILLVFLKNIRPTFVIACSIPISIMTALVLMYFSGVTLNVISLSGLALGVGMLVDNSIVVIENIYRMRNEGIPAKEAAIKGATEVGSAIIASTLTTVCVFLPIVFTTGITRQLFVDMGLTVAYSLLASLIVALTLVPMISATVLKKTTEKESKLLEKIKTIYGKILGKVYDKKGLVFLISIVLFAGSIFLAYSKGTEFIPPMETNEISVTLETENGMSFKEQTEEGDKLMEKLSSLSDIESVGGMIGASSSMLGFVSSSSSNEPVEYYAIIKDNAKLSNDQIAEKIKDFEKDIKGEITVSTSNMDMSALGSSGIEVQIKGRDLDELLRIAKTIKGKVEAVEGTANVTDGTEESKKELRVVVDKEKALKKNLTVAQVFQEVNKELAANRAATTLSTNEEEYNVFVIDEVKEKLTRDDIQKMSITAEALDGSKEKVPLKDIAQFEEGEGLNAISRTEHSRVMRVNAEVKNGYNIGLVSREVEKVLSKYESPKGYEIKMVGEDETINNAMEDLFKMLALAIVFMYLIMVAQFQSLRSPFIVMFTVPLAFTGGLFALWLTNKPISVIAMIGFVMLAGIIVNNGIVYIDYTNQLVAEGMETKEALILAGKTRLRPILMTALTTILGLSTMAVGVGMGADLIQPMAIVTIGGLIYGTLLTLIVVPCIYGLFKKKEKARLREES